MRRALHTAATPEAAGFKPRPHLHRDWAHPAHVCAGTGPAGASGLQLLVLVHSACRVGDRFCGYPEYPCEYPGDRFCGYPEYPCEYPGDRFCGYRFSMDANSLSDQYIHLTNNAIQKTSDKYDRAHGAGKWSLRSLKLYMASKHGLGASRRCLALLGFRVPSADRLRGDASARLPRSGPNLVCSVIRQRW